MSIFDIRERFFSLPKPNRLNSIEEIFGSEYVHFTCEYKCEYTLSQLLQDGAQEDVVTEEDFDSIVDINSSFWDWVPLTDFVKHEFMPFYYTVLLVNANPDSSEYKNISLLYQKEGSGYEIKKLFTDIDSFLEEFKNYEKNKPLLNNEYLNKVKEYEQLYDSRVWLAWIRSSFSNYLLSKHGLHEEDW